MSINCYISRVVRLNALISIVIFPVQSFAVSEFTPRFSFQERWLTYSSFSLDEEGATTVFTPGINFLNQTKRTRLNLDLEYHVELNQGLERDEAEYQNLSLLYAITHIPDHWETHITGNVKQVSTDLEGIQVLNPDLNVAGTQQLRAYGISTSINKVIKQRINVQSQLLANVSENENSDPSEGLGFNLAIDNKVSGNRLFWDLSTSAQKSMGTDNDSEITNWQFGMNYRIDSRYTTYLTTTLTDTSNSELNDSSTLIGFNWHPNSRNNINFAAGVRGDSNTYSLTSVYKKKKVSLTLNYSEEVTSSRIAALEQLNDDGAESITYLSLQEAPLLQQSANINLSLTGNRTTISFNYLSRIRNIEHANSEDERLDSITLAMDRQLTRKSSLTASFQKQQSYSTEENNVDEWRFSYNRSLSKYLNMVVDLNKTEQQSDVVDNEYEQTVLGVSISGLF